MAGQTGGKTVVRSLFVRGSIALTVSLWAMTAMANPPNADLLCAEEKLELTSDRFLRAVSFDLRGRPPTAGEVRVLRDSDDGEVPEWLIDHWLEDDAFAEQVVRRHRAYLWNNITNTRLVNPNSDLGQRSGIYWVNRRANRYRPSPVDRPHCGDFPAEFDEDGRILTRMNADDVPQEGYVEVSPYWAPETTIRVCAFDAQTTAVTSNGTPCNVRNGINNAECGCGPNLVYCAPGQFRTALKEAMGRSIELTIEAIIKDKEPYTNLFESQRFFVNGPMVHFYRHQAPGAQALFTPSPVNLSLVPDIAAHERDRWIEMRVGQEHAGILTHPAFLMRFQTDRARAATFYQEFLCGPFQPPAAGLPPADEEAARNPDLQERAGCKYCHSGLEPAAAHWGRWSEEGAGYINESDFPAEDPECVACANGTGPCTSRCRTHYLTRTLSDQEDPYLGMLKSFVFRRNEHMHHIDQGPKYLARAATADNRLPRCVAQQSAAWLLGRSLDRPGDAKWLTELSVEFVQSGFDFRHLVKLIVTSDRYRRVQ